MRKKRKKKKERIKKKEIFQPTTEPYVAAEICDFLQPGKFVPLLRKRKKRETEMQSFELRNYTFMYLC